MANRKKDIIKIIKGIAGTYSEYEVFSDWVKCSAIAIDNQLNFFHDKVWQDRENTYLGIMKKYTEAERMQFVKMLAMLTETFDDYMSDVLGEIYMEAGMGSKATGQFFTPFHLSEATARMALKNEVESFDGRKITVNEPSTGGGGMVIAAAKVLKDNGINYQQYMDVVAQDLDWKGVYMTYLQCSLLGIPAIVVQGDSLAEPYRKGYSKERVLITPAKRGLLI